MSQEKSERRNLKRERSVTPTPCPMTELLKKLKEVTDELDITKRELRNSEVQVDVLRNNEAALSNELTRAKSAASFWKKEWMEMETNRREATHAIREFSTQLNEFCNNSDLQHKYLPEQPTDD